MEAGRGWFVLSRNNIFSIYNESSIPDYSINWPPMVSYFRYSNDRANNLDETVNADSI